jgi:50S ribosomal protein L16 3-hydroxylase
MPPPPRRASAAGAPPIEVDARGQPPLGMPAADFLRHYWQKRPLLVRNAFPGFEAPLQPEDLAGLACEEAALSRIVLHDATNDAWTLRTGPFAEEEFPGMPHADWTLLVQDVDKWDMDVAALLQRFDFLPRWRVDDVMVSFAAPGGSVGAHVDQYDVFLLQGQGRRRWQIDAGEAPPTAFREDVELKLLREFTPSHDWVLAPGDMLYLPPGVPHHGVAIDACLTFSIGMRAPARSELLVEFAEFLAESLPDEARYTDADLAPPADAGEIDDDALARLQRALPWLRPDDPKALGEFFGRFITRYRSAGEIAPPPRPPSARTIETTLAAGGALVRHPFSRSAWTRAGDAARLFVDGEAYPASAATARRLADPAPLSAADWQALDADGRALLHDLAERGRYALSRPSRRRRR